MSPLPVRLAVTAHAASLGCLLMAHLERGVSAKTVFEQYDRDDETITFPEDDEVLFENVTAAPWLLAAAVLLVLGTGLLVRACAGRRRAGPAEHG